MRLQSIKSVINYFSIIIYSMMTAHFEPDMRIRTE
jgi:hypothetical protein